MNNKLLKQLKKTIISVKKIENNSKNNDVLRSEAHTTLEGLYAWVQEQHTVLHNPLAIDVLDKRTAQEKSIIGPYLGFNVLPRNYETSVENSPSVDEKGN